MKTTVVLFSLLGATVRGLYADYQLHRAHSQLVMDTSGSELHAVNGETLFQEVNDVIWTDRGAYLEYSQFITLPKNVVSASLLALPSNTTLIFWLCPLEPEGVLFSYGTELVFYLSNGELCYDYALHSVCQSTSVTLKGII